MEYYGSAHAWPLQTLTAPYPFNYIEVSYPVYVVCKIYDPTNVPHTSHKKYSDSMVLRIE